MCLIDACDDADIRLNEVAKPFYIAGVIFAQLKDKYVLISLELAYE